MNAARSLTPAAADKTVEEALARVGSPEEILQRHGVTVRRRVARCPFHEDRTPSLSLFTGRDGKDRWRCHGCGVGGDALDLAERLGERIELRREPAGTTHRNRREPPGTTPHLEERVRRLLHEATLIERLTAVQLARLCRNDAMVELSRIGEWLSDQGVDLVGVVHLSDALRAYLPEKYGVPAAGYWPVETVRRLAEEVLGGP